MSRRPALTVADLRMETVARLAAGAALFVVAASFTYSFAQIKWVSDQLGGGDTPGWLSYLFPLIIDAPALVASALSVALHDRSMRVRQYTWTVLGVFTAASWACNAVHALTFSTIGLLAGPAGVALIVLIAGFPPVGVVLGVHLWAFALRHSPGADQRAPLERAREREPERPSAPAAASVMRNANRITPKPEPAPAPAPTPRGRVPAASTYRETARALYEQMRAETPPGQQVDAAELRRRLGPPENGGSLPSAQTVRRWRSEFEAEDQDATSTSEPTVGERQRVRAV